MAEGQEAPGGIASAHGVRGSAVSRPIGMLFHWVRNLSFGRAALYVFSAAVLLYIIAPMFITVPISFSDYKFLKFPPDKWSLRWYENYFTSSKWISSTIDSFIVAPLVVAPCALVLTPISEVNSSGGSEFQPLCYFVRLKLSDELLRYKVSQERLGLSSLYC